tara:strand:+ start:248 stop:1153 length:906 start_codon:yes stop_codon:yes gene_type:complete
MFNIGLTEFIKTPWTARIRDVMFNALNVNKNIKCEKIHNYPKKNYDILILVGIRSLSKANLDIERLRKNVKILIEIGDSGIDPRKTYEDYYFYFIPTEKPLFKHYIYLPKFIDENYLYPEQSKKITVFVDHYKHQTESEKEISIRSILNIFENLKKYRNKIDIYFHTSKGIELNPEKITIPADKKNNFKYMDFEEISKYYRKCNIFFPTHRESQGMLAQEIGACGGLTIMQKWMYPIETHYQFEHLLYDFKNFVDFKKVLDICQKKDFIQKNRDRVLKNCSISLFNNSLNDKIEMILSKHF